MTKRITPLRDRADWKFARQPIVSACAAGCLLSAIQPAPAGSEPDGTVGNRVAAKAQSAGATMTTEAQGQVEKQFARTVDEYFDGCFRDNPEWATNVGFHQYDHLLPDLSEARVKSRIMELKRTLKVLEQLNPQTLTQQGQIDSELIVAHIKAILLDLEEVETWRKNPDHYSSTASSSIHCLMTREFAPPEARLKSVIEREKQIPRLLAQARRNLSSPPRIYTEVALEQLPGIIDFFAKSVPEKFATVKDEALQAELVETTGKAIEALRDYQVFLREKLLPASTGDFALGPDRYAKKLLYEEMINTPLDELLKTGESELRRLQTRFIATCKAIDPNAYPKELFARISGDHPSADKLIESVAGVLQKLKDMCIAKEIVTIPYDDELKVDETPPFMRALSFASMDTPGPFESKAKESYYYVTLPGSDWTPERAEEHLRSFCRLDLINTSVHEAFPGHFVQGLWNRKAPSKTTKILGCGSNAEGWAHYCEEMMVEEGLENFDDKLKLVQLHDALLRVCRYLAGIKMHTQGMTVDQATELFVREGYQERANALREAKRGTMDPTYLVYTLGKLQIMDLRSRAQERQGKQFSLKNFHDQFLSQGAIPVTIIRRVMLRS